MDDNSSSDTGTSGGADTGALGGIDNMFETTAVQSKFKDLAKLIKDSWKNADFTEVGAIVGRKLNAALRSIHGMISRILRTGLQKALRHS